VTVASTLSKESLPANPVIACVLAGGVGTRLYPRSQADRPKQLRRLGGERTLLERTLDRVAPVVDATIVLTSRDLEDAVRETVPETPILVEPEARGTGPALTYAARVLQERGLDDAVMITLPSDHHVADGGAFRALLERAVRVTQVTADLVTLGVEPTRPATEFGYVIGTDRVRSTANGDEYRRVERFREKPDADVARTLLEDGARWNAGIFAWTPKAFLREVRATPLESLLDVLERKGPPEDGRVERAFDVVDPVGVDRAVLERTDRALVVDVPSRVGWADLGTWDAIGRLADPFDEPATGGRIPDLVCDDRGNAALETEYRALEASRNVVSAPEHVVSLLEVENLIVAVEAGHVLVAPRTAAGRVEDVVEARTNRTSSGMSGVTDSADEG